MMNIKQKRIITAWLMSGIFLIALMIVIGGVTRITESGLSMVNWSIPGELPTEKNIEKSYIEWQKSPQGKHLNSLDFEEFKTISSLDAIYFSNGSKKPCWTIMNSIRNDMFYSFNGGKPNIADRSDLVKMIKKKPVLF